MASSARRRLAILVPWVAFLAVLAVLVFRVAGGAGATPKRGPQPVAAESPPRKPAPPPSAAPGAPSASHAMKQTETTLVATFQDLETARGDLDASRKETAKALAALEDRGARLAVAEARITSLEDQVQRQEAEANKRAQETTVLREKARSLEKELETRKDPVHGWVEDAASGSPARRTAARKAAAHASPEQIQSLESRLDAKDAPVVAVARLVGALPQGDASDALARAVLEAPATTGRPEETVAALGVEVLERPAVASALLRKAPPAVRGEGLRWLAGVTDLPDQTRARLSGDAAWLIGRRDAESVRQGAEAAALLRLPGLAEKLLALLSAPDAGVRAAGAHALSRVPDLDRVKDQARSALPRLLGDEHSQDVRTAGVLLAEALLGHHVDFDPAAGPAARRRALDRLLDEISAAAPSH